MSIDNSTGKTKGFYERGQAMFDRIPGMPEDDAPAKTWPTKICSPNLVGILNAAGFYQKKDWVGLTDEDIKKCIAATIKVTDHLLLDAVQAVVIDVEAKLKEKNGG